MQEEPPGPLLNFTVLAGGFWISFLFMDHWTVVSGMDGFLWILDFT